MNNTHGKVGGNLFILLFVLAVLTPLTRVWYTTAQPVAWGALSTALFTLVVTVITIRALGGATIGEALGLLAGGLAWLGRLGGPFAAGLISKHVDNDLLRVIGSSLLPILMCIIVWSIAFWQSR